MVEEEIEVHLQTQLEEVPEEEILEIVVSSEGEELQIGTPITGQALTTTIVSSNLSSLLILIRFKK